MKGLCHSPLGGLDPLGTHCDKGPGIHWTKARGVWGRTVGKEAAVVAFAQTENCAAMKEQAPQERKLLYCAAVQVEALGLLLWRKVS